MQGEKRRGNESRYSSSAYDSRERSRKEFRGQSRLYRKYRPAFENLILFFLDSRFYIRYFKDYLREEFGARSRLLLKGILLLVAGLVFLAATIISLVLGSFFFLEHITGSRIWAALIVAGSAGMIAATLLVWMSLSFRSLTDFSKRSEDKSRD